MRIPLLISPALRAAGFAHGFTTRDGGASPPPFDSLDFTTLRDPQVLRENQRRLAAAVGFDPSRLFQTKQVHGRAVFVASGEPHAAAEVEADALIAEPGSSVAVAVRIADCVPVLLADRATGRVAAVHAGWRGVALGVLPAALERFARTAEVVAAVGPSIGPCCFEVGEDVAEKIAGATTDEAVARRDRARGKAWIDLRRGVRAQLLAAGVASIDDVPGCTRCDAKRFYSFRRDGDATGRHLGVIVARPTMREASAIGP